MAKTRSVKPVEQGAFRLTFPDARIAEFGRVDPASGWVKFQCNLNPKSINVIFGHFGWEAPGDKSKLETFDGKLEGGSFILTSKDKLVDGEVDISYTTCNSFACHRFELEGRKKKGFRRELRFTVTFKQQDACALLESYMMTTDNARGVLQLTYVEQPEQISLVEATDEQRQATLPAAD